MNRRDFLGILALGALLNFEPINDIAFAQVNSSSQGSELFTNKEFSYQALRALSKTYSSCADIKECFLAIKSIKDNDTNSWYEGWKTQGDRLYSLAEEYYSEGFLVSARESYLRASNYLRTSGFFLGSNPKDSRIFDTYSRSRASFVKAASLFNPKIESIEIQYQNTTIPLYFVKASNDQTPRPTIVLVGGFDSNAEELIMDWGFGVVKRGFNCVSFDGPGQGRALILQGLYFRPDFEKVSKPIINYIITRRDVDLKKIAMFGLDLGGYFAPRACAFDSRIALLVADGGVFDYYSSLISLLPAVAKNLLETDKAAFNKAMTEALKDNITFRWAIHHGMWAFNAPTIADFFLKTKQYNLKNIISNINCPTLVVNSTNTFFFKGESKKFYDLLECPREIINMTASEGAEEGSQVGALGYAQGVILNWIEYHLNKITG